MESILSKKIKIQLKEEPQNTIAVARLLIVDDSFDQIANLDELKEIADDIYHEVSGAKANLDDGKKAAELFWIKVREAYRKKIGEELLKLLS